MKTNRKNAFTLVEVLVAVAVLVIMMAFIFQYTASAQRLWAANTARTEMSAQADALFSLLDQDLENMYVVQKNEEIDAQAGWYCCHKKEGGSAGDTSAFPVKVTGGSVVKLADYNLQDFCFFTEDSDPESTGADAHATVYPVRYHFDYEEPGEVYNEGRGKLYRYVTEERQWDKVAEKFDAAARGKDPDFYAGIPVTEADKEEYLLVENVKAIRIFSDAAFDDEETDSNAFVFRKKPAWFRVEITLSVPENLRNGATADESSNRTFSRVFQLDR